MHDLARIGLRPPSLPRRYPGEPKAWENPLLLPCKKFSQKNRQGNLRTYQIELEKRNEELRRAQEELGAWRRKYADLYDFAPVGYFTFDANGLIKEVNLTGVDLLSLDKRFLIDKPFSRFIIPDDQTPLRLNGSQAIFRKGWGFPASSLLVMRILLWTVNVLPQSSASFRRRSRISPAMQKLLGSKRASQWIRVR